MTDLNARDVMKQGRLFAADHVVTLCAEITDWQVTGYLVNGRLRELAKMLQPICDMQALTLAEKLAHDAARDFVVNAR